MNLKSFLAAAVAAMGITAMANPTLVVDKVEQAGGVATITYTASDLDAYDLSAAKFVFEITADGTTKAYTNANVAANGTATTTVNFKSDFGGADLLARASYHARVENAQPLWLGDVMVIDISAGPSATTYPVTYMQNVDSVSFNTYVYKTDKIVLRKIKAGTYPCAPGVAADLTSDQTLSVPNDYYIGVFPITAYQYQKVMGTNPCGTGHWPYDIYPVGGTECKNASSGYDLKVPTAPVDSVSWDDLRGAIEPNQAVAANATGSFIARLLAKAKDGDTLVGGFDLPTEVQWEIACRAKSSYDVGAYLDNSKTSTKITFDNIDNCAWTTNNAALVTHAVGQKFPNQFGLYDMQGNVWEWCIDRYASTFNPDEMPQYSDTSYNSGENRVMRGASWWNTMYSARPSQRGIILAEHGGVSYGFRLARTCR